MSKKFASCHISASDHVARQKGRNNNMMVENTLVSPSTFKNE